MGVRTIPHRLRSEAPGLLLLAFVLAFNTILLAPEVHIERVHVNDLAFPIAASQRLGQRVANAEPFLDPWVSKWSLGFPVWRSYQPVPHLIAARDYEGLPGFAPPPARRRWLSSALKAATSKRHLRTYERSSTGAARSRLGRQGGGVWRNVQNWRSLCLLVSQQLRLRRAASFLPLGKRNATFYR
jgi:hypothetical protein